MGSLIDYKKPLKVIHLANDLETEYWAAKTAYT